MSCQKLIDFINPNVASLNIDLLKGILERGVFDSHNYLFKPFRMLIPFCITPVKPSIEEAKIFKLGLDWSGKIKAVVSRNFGRSFGSINTVRMLYFAPIDSQSFSTRRPLDNLTEISFIYF